MIAVIWCVSIWLTAMQLNAGLSTQSALMLMKLQLAQMLFRHPIIDSLLRKEDHLLVRQFLGVLPLCI